MGRNGQETDRKQAGKWVEMGRRQAGNGLTWTGNRQEIGREWVEMDRKQAGNG